ncbi:MAG: phage minor head protein [Monoglobales bacterium]
MATYKESDLERYLVQVRRIAESREAGAERKIRKMYKELAEDLNSWLGNVYAKYAEDDRLDYSILRSKGQYAWFLEEVQSKIDGIYPELKSEVENLIDTTYKVCWHGMYNGVTKSKRVEDLKKTFSASKSITPEQIKAAVQNPISKLRLNPVLNRNRQQIISNIRREIGVGLSNGDRMSTMARRIQHYVDNDRSKALLIARTEAHRVREVGFNDSAERIDKIMQDNQSDYRMVKTWRNVGDLAVRKTDKANHVDMEGQTVLADEEFTMVRSRTKAKCPGTSGIAAEDCNCRCRASRDIMNDAEFYAATGRHFPGYVAPTTPIPNNSNNTLQNQQQNDTIEKSDIRENLEKSGITYNEVGALPKALSSSEIIARLGGGDMTSGSCSSLGFAYIGNMHGYDVLDFRGGNSQHFFALNSNIKKMLDLPGIKGSVTKVKKEAGDTAKIINGLEYDKEYYLAVGRHAAIIRNTEHGAEYLELQSAKYNGWHPFDIYGSTITTLQKRFGCRKTADRMRIGSQSVVFEKEVVLMEVDSFINNDEFRRVLGYINTVSTEQKKGAMGNVI